MSPTANAPATLEMPEPPAPEAEQAPTSPGDDDRPAHMLDTGDRRARSRPLRRRLLVVGLLAAPVVALAAMPALRFDNWPWWSLGLTAPIVAWGAAPFHRRAWAQLRRGAGSRDTLVSISVLAGLGWSLYSLVVGDAGADGAGGLDATRPLELVRTTGEDQIYLAIPAGLTFLALAGRYLERRLEWSDPPLRWRDADVTLLRTVGGSAGTDRWTDSNERPSAGERLAARAAVLVVALAAGALGFWLAADDDVTAAVWAATAVLVVACPAGLVLADALPFARAARRATELRIRLGDAAVPEAASRVDTLVVDRQGTLTTGEPVLLDVVTVDAAPVDELLQLVGSLGVRSQHPVLRAVAASAHARDLALDQADLVVDDPAVGAIRGVVRGRQVAVGDERSVAGGTRPLPEHIARTRAAAEQAGRLTLLVAWEESVRGLLLAVDPLRPGGAEAVDQLDAQQVRPVLLTSDRRPVADAAAAAVGIEEVMAPIPPDGQPGAVRLLESQGRVVATVNRHGGQGTLHIDRQVPDHSGADLWSAAEGVHLARAAARQARQNRWLAWACGAIALAVAAAGRLDPAAAMVAGAASVLVVAINSLRPARLSSVRLPAHRRW